MEVANNMTLNDFLVLFNNSVKDKYIDFHAVHHLTSCLGMYSLITAGTYNKLMHITVPMIRNNAAVSEVPEDKIDEYADVIMRLLTDDRIFRGFHRYVKSDEGLERLSDFLGLFKIPDFFDENKCNHGEYYHLDPGDMTYASKCFIRKDTIYFYRIEMNVCVVFKRDLDGTDNKWVPQKDDASEIISVFEIEDYMCYIVPFSQFIVFETGLKMPDLCCHHVFEFDNETCTEYKGRVFFNPRAASEYDRYWYTHKNMIFFYDGADYFADSFDYLMMDNRVFLINKAEDLMHIPVFTDDGLEAEIVSVTGFDGKKEIDSVFEIKGIKEIFWNYLINKYLNIPLYKMNPIQQFEYHLIVRTTPEFNLESLIEIPQKLYEAEIINSYSFERAKKLLEVIKGDTEGEDFFATLFYIELFSQETSLARHRFISERRIHSHSLIGNFGIKDGELSILRVLARFGSVDFTKEIIYPENFFARRKRLTGSVYYDMNDDKFVIDTAGYTLTDMQISEIINKFKLEDYRFAEG